MSRERIPDTAVPATESVRAYYNDFAQSRQLSYVQESNLRVERAIARILPMLTLDSNVLEIGCGIGLVAERIGAVATRGSVWGCDISDKSIQYAEQRVRMANLSFRTIDVLKHFDELMAWVPLPVQLVVMVDVIEHCPLSEHSGLFRNLRSIMAENASMFLSFPSPQYQQYLRQTNPCELQVIDEIVHLKHIQYLIEETGLVLKHFSLEDIWLKNQYVHCILSTTASVEPLEIDRRIRKALEEVAAHVPTDQIYILVDDGQWSGHPMLESGGRRAIPFLERDGTYWGKPPDDETAIHELNRLEQAGANFIVFGSPAFWWFEYYAVFCKYLRTQFECVKQNEDIVVFDLRKMISRP